MRERNRVSEGRERKWKMREEEVMSDTILLPY